MSLEAGLAIVTLGVANAVVWLSLAAWYVRSWVGGQEVPRPVVAGAVVGVLAGAVGGLVTGYAFLPPGLQFLGVMPPDMTRLVAATWRMAMLMAGGYAAVGAWRARSIRPPGPR